MATTIKVRENGSYLIESEDAVLVDWNGNKYEIPKRPFSLCRCGHSHRKPFCDGTHRNVGFIAGESAAPIET
jgi:CDGSH-type Zn-finger protein